MTFESTTILLLATVIAVNAAVDNTKNIKNDNDLLAQSLRSSSNKDNSRPGIAVMRLFDPQQQQQVTTPSANTTATFGNGILPTARQPSEDWPFTTTTSRRTLSVRAPPRSKDQQRPLIDGDEQAPMTWSKSRTINFTAFFDKFEANIQRQLALSSSSSSKRRENNNNNVIQMAPTRIEAGQTFVHVSPLESVHLQFYLQHGQYLTTVLQPSLVARRKVFVEDRTYDFNITLQLHKWNTTDRVNIGAQITQTVTQGRYTANPVIVLRWPFEYRSVVQFDSPFNLVDQKAGSLSSRLGIDVTVVLSLPSGSPQPLNVNPNERRPLQRNNNNK